MLIQDRQCQIDYIREDMLIVNRFRRNPQALNIIDHKAGQCTGILGIFDLAVFLAFFYSGIEVFLSLSIALADKAIHFLVMRGYLYRGIHQETTFMLLII